MNIFFPFIFSFSGVLFGKVLSIIAKEEIKPGKKYFLIILDVLTLLLLLFVLLSFSFSLTYFVLRLAIGILLSFLSVFFILGFVGVLGISYISSFLTSSFIFLFGLVYGSFRGPSFFPIPSFIFWLFLCFLFYGLAFLTLFYPISHSAVFGVLVGGFGALIFRRWQV